MSDDALFGTHNGRRPVMILSPHEIAWCVQQFWTVPADQQTAVAVALAESAGETDALARSKTGENVGQRDHGLFQISGRYHGPKLVGAAPMGWRDPLVNTELAYAVWSEKRAFTPWSVFGSKSYEAFLPDAVFGLANPFPPPVSAMRVWLDLDIPGLLIDVGRTTQSTGRDVAAIRAHFA